MKHILHLITNPVDSTLRATIESQSARPDLRVTIVTTLNHAEIGIPSNKLVISSLDDRSRASDAVTSLKSAQSIGYDGLMDLIFEAELVVSW